LIIKYLKITTYSKTSILGSLKKAGVIFSGRVWKYENKKNKKKLVFLA